MMDPMSIEEQVVVVTGAARGIGRAVARGFLERGAKVVALDRSWTPSGLSGDQDDGFLDWLQGRDDVLVLTCDITCADHVRKAYDATLRRFARVDVLVNNAALLPSAQFPPTGDTTVMNTSDADWERSLAVNLLGPLRVTRLFIQPMLANEDGSVITMSSDGGTTTPHPDGISYVLRRPHSREQPYQAAKAGLTSLFGYLAEEIKESNVAVNLVVPTRTRTTGFDEKTEERNRRGVPSRGVGAKPEHVLPLVMFLAQQRSRTGITGRVFEAMPWNEANGFGGWEAWSAT